MDPIKMPAWLLDDLAEATEPSAAYLEKERLAALQERRRRHVARGIPEILLGAKRSDFAGDLLQGEIPEAPTDLLILGGVGRGKTYLAAALAMEWHAVWVDAAWFIVEIRSTMNSRSEETEASILTRYSQAPVLVIDDITAVTATDFALKTLLALLSRRIGKGLATIVTSNANRDDIELMEPSIASRLGGFHRVRLLGPDRRAK